MENVLLNKNCFIVYYKVSLFCVLSFAVLYETQNVLELFFINFYLDNITNKNIYTIQKQY